MNEGKSIFSQLMDFLADREFRRCVARYRGDRYTKKLSCWEQFLAMAFAQLAYRESLRDIEACLGAIGPKLYHMGFGSAVARSTGGSTTSTGCVTYAKALVICAGPPGAYGTLGTSASGNIPGGRAAAASWIDGSGNFWLFGGQGYDSAANQGNLNDLWKFDPNDDVWTWTAGNSSEAGCMVLPEGNTFCRGQPGVYGSLSVPGPVSEPGGRCGVSRWIDRSGNIWLFGGYGADSTGVTGVLSDLWEYRP